MSKNNPFEIWVSDDAEMVVFDDKWDHVKNYRALFNAQRDVLSRWKNKHSRWGMIADWRKLIVQVPEAERLCILNIQELADWGLSFYAPIVYDIAVAKWQAQQVLKKLPDLPLELCVDYDRAYQLLKQNGYSTDFQKIDDKPAWNHYSEAFEEKAKSLTSDYQKFLM